MARACCRRCAAGPSVGVKKLTIGAGDVVVADVAPVGLVVSARLSQDGR